MAIGEKMSKYIPEYESTDVVIVRENNFVEEDIYNLFHSWYWMERPGNVAYPELLSETDLLQEDIKTVGICVWDTSDGRHWFAEGSQIREVKISLVDTVIRRTEEGYVYAPEVWDDGTAGIFQKIPWLHPYAASRTSAMLA